jgi:hypothetical protein
MRVCRASTGGHTGGQGPTRAIQVYLILRIENLPYVDQVRILDRLLAELRQALPTALDVIALSDLAKHVTALDVNDFIASTVLLLSRLLGDLDLRVAHVLRFGRSGIARRRCLPLGFPVRLGQCRPLSHWATRSHTVVAAASAGVAATSPIPEDRSSAAPTPMARLMMVEVT